MEKLKNKNLPYRDEYDESVIQVTGSIPAAAAPHLAIRCGLPKESLNSVR